MEQQNPVYSPKVIEFVAVATESVSFFENVSAFRRKDFLQRLSKLLSLIYLKANMLSDFNLPEDDNLEQFVTEQEYENVRQNISALLAEFDSFVDYAYAEEQWNDLPEAASVSENVADLYQDLKDFTLRYQIGNDGIMFDAVAICIQSFREYWGLKLLSALKAIHQTINGGALPDDDEEDSEEHECSCGHHHEHGEHCSCGHHHHEDSFLHRRINEMHNEMGTDDLEGWEK